MERDWVQETLIQLRPNNLDWYGWKDLSAGHSWENTVSIVDGVAKPTKKEFDAKYNELIAEYENNEYQRQRAVEYPRLEEQLDYIYHYGVDAWKTNVIDPVKNKYPKPE